MTSRFKSALFGFSALLALGACSGVNMDGGQYWQRSSVSEAVYVEGPKAQQMLNRDISRCVTELHELEGLGSVRNAIPTDASGKLLDPDERQLADNDTPERDGKLLVEHSDYQDFEGCMLAKGWERVKFVPYEVAKKSRKTWFTSNVNYGSDPADAPVEAPAAPHNGYND